MAQVLLLLQASAGFTLDEDERVSVTQAVNTNTVSTEMIQCFIMIIHYAKSDCGKDGYLFYTFEHGTDTAKC
jgi:hypothetical protein